MSEQLAKDLVEKEERSELKKIVADIEASELVEEEVVT
jgi:hypothetical protein